MGVFYHQDGNFVNLYIDARTTNNNGFDEIIY